jgi:adenylosuccinate synthase
MINGIDALALPKLDVLDELEEIKICRAYRLRGEVTEDMPYGATELAECEPVYETMPGWKTSTSGITDYDLLPGAAKDYISRIEELCGAPVALISTGPERTETIIREQSPVKGWMSR